MILHKILWKNKKIKIKKLNLPKSEELLLKIILKHYKKFRLNGKKIVYKNRG